MYTIDLAYVGRGLHEELVAYIADQQDYYADEGVHVALRDGCSWDEERLRPAPPSGSAGHCCPDWPMAFPGSRSLSTLTARCSGSSPAPA